MTTDTWQTLGRPIGTAGRWCLALCCLVLLAGFGLAAGLDPDPRGYGTHQRLGLPECSFQMLFDRPCPGCGMTTSFSHFVRGNWAASFRSNPAGLLLAISCAGLVPWLVWSAAIGRLWLVTDPWPALACLMAGWGVASLLVWIPRWWV